MRKIDGVTVHLYRDKCGVIREDKSYATYPNGEKVNGEIACELEMGANECLIAKISVYVNDVVIIGD